MQKSEENTAKKRRIEIVLFVFPVVSIVFPVGMKVLNLDVLMNRLVYTSFFLGFLLLIPGVWAYFCFKYFLVQKNKNNILLIFCLLMATTFFIIYLVFFYIWKSFA